MSGNRPRILIDAYWWQSGPPSGKNIVRALVHGWARDFPDDDLHVIVANDVRPEEPLPPCVTQHQVRVRPHALAAAWSSGRIGRSIGADATYTQNFAVPHPSRTAVFVHDAIFRSHPKWFTPAERLYFTPMAPLARRAGAVLTSTQSEARRIEREFGVANVRAVGLGVGEPDAPIRSARPGLVPDGDRFVLSVGRLNVRKNLERLLKAASESDVISPSTPLLVVGEPDGRVSELPESIKRKRDVGAIRFLGFVSDAELKWLYENAVALAFPSLDEGFGLPPIEAAAHGCRSIVSDIPVFRETLASLAPIYVDPLRVNSIRLGLEIAVKENLRIPKAEPYTWDAMVERTRSAILELTG